MQIPGLRQKNALNARLGSSSVINECVASLIKYLSLQGAVTQMAAVIPPKGYVAFVYAQFKRQTSKVSPGLRHSNTTAVYGSSNPPLNTQFTRLLTCDDVKLILNQLYIIISASTQPLIHKAILS